jgi:hypothetical protein
VQPARVAADIDLPEVAAKRVKQVIAPLAIFRAHAHDVRGIAAGADHLRHRRLGHPRTAAVQQPLGGAHRIDQRCRDGHVAKAHAVTERLGEVGAVDRALRGIRGQRGRRASFVTEIRPAVVL